MTTYTDAEGHTWDVTATTWVAALLSRPKVPARPDLGRVQGFVPVTAFLAAERVAPKALGR